MGLSDRDQGWEHDMILWEVLWSGRRTGGRFYRMFPTEAEAQRHAAMLRSTGAARTATVQPLT